MIDDLAACFSGQIPVLDLANVQLCIPEQPRAICFHRAYMVGVLMGDKDMVYRLRINPKPAHFFGKAVVVISRIDHNSRIAFAVEEDVRHPFAHAGNILVDPAGVQWLEAVSYTHLVTGGAGAETARTWAASIFHHRSHGMDGQFCL